MNARDIINDLSETETEVIYPDIEEWTDGELRSAWDHLEKMRGPMSAYVEQKMDEILREQGRRENRRSMNGPEVRESADGARLSLADLVKAYQVDFIGDPGFVDHYFLRRQGNDYVYKVIGHDDTADNPWFVTDVYVSPRGSRRSLEFPGVVQAESEDEGAMREVFDAGRPPPNEDRPSDDQPPGSGGGGFSPKAPGPFGHRYRNTGDVSRGNKWQDQQYRDTQDRGWA